MLSWTYLLYLVRGIDQSAFNFSDQFPCALIQNAATAEEDFQMFQYELHLKNDYKANVKIQSCSESNH